MNLIRVESLEDLEELLEHKEISRKNTAIINISEVIKSKKLPSYTVFDYQALIPSPGVINIYIEDGYSEDYFDAYKEYLEQPDAAFFLNEIIHNLVVYDSNTILLCDQDEKDFRYIKMLAKVIEDRFGITTVSVKKFYKGKRTECDRSIKGLIEYTTEKRKSLIKKLDDSGISLPFSMQRRFTKEELKKLPKKIRKMFKKHLKGDD